MFTLNNVLKANAISCLLFGLLFLSAPASVSAYLSAVDPVPILILYILGVGLLLNGAHLLWGSRKRVPSKFLIFYFSAGDFVWVLASVGLVISNIWITTTAGIALSLIIALMVGVFGCLQIIKRKEIKY